ncbi:MAG: putative rane protein [Herbinix sp.]|jgi:hypothetical protein|nr:putative rane protein [Herbinix sp.]
MLGLIYLFLCFGLGFVICTYAFPGLGRITEVSYDGQSIHVSPYIVLLPAWFITGTLVMTWITYLTALLFSEAKVPLSFANSLTMTLVSITVGSVIYLRNRGKGDAGQHNICIFAPFFNRNKKAVFLESILLAAITVLACTLMWITFFVKDSNLYVGVTVFSDFSPHIGMIRSFSYGNNFPTQYSHFAGEDIKYHFLFQFLVGNLEFLGLRLDYAFNLPSILSFIGAFLLLYLLAVKITAKLTAGVLACLFFAFRSSKSLFIYLSQLPDGTNLIKALTDNMNFVASTPNEDWGLWNLNVYCNQRHLAFGLAGIFLVLILLLPRLYEMFDDLKQPHKNTADRETGNFVTMIGKGKRFFMIAYFRKEGWEVKDIRLCVCCGILLGSLSFFNGATVIGCLLVLFVIAILSKRRLEFLTVAVIAIVLSLLQTHLFIHGNAVSTSFFFGFLAEVKTLLGAASYLERLLGILPFVLFVAFCTEKGVGRYLMAAFTMPLVFAFTVSLTTDIAVNHKYIMISCILLSVYAAAFISKIWQNRVFFLHLVGVILIIMLTATGIYDFITVIKKNNPQYAIKLDLANDVTRWVDSNSDSKDIFLTASYSLNQVVLGGAMLYQGWQYYAWSAGYDTFYRDEMVKSMYEAKSPPQLDYLVKENNIRYIIVDKDNRDSNLYVVNEDNIEATYPIAYTVGEGEWKFTIYDTRHPLYE